MRIAVIGGGISGLGAALILQQAHQVSLFEAQQRLGGHSRTIDVTVDGKRIAVDTGFIVHNRGTYPLLCAMFSWLGVETIKAPMSFGVHARDGRYSWSSASILNYFGSWRNISSADHWRMIHQLGGFFKKARGFLDARDQEGGEEPSLREWIAEHNIPRLVCNRYLLPMGAAIWSTTQHKMLDFPAKSLLNFLDNHRLLQFSSQHQWLTVAGGSRSYVEKLKDRLKAEVINEAAAGIKRTADGVTISTSGGEHRSFDALVLACHSDQGLAALADADEKEKELLGSVGFAENEAVLHTDARLMPERRNDWASWVSVVCSPGTPHSVNYWMNNLQQLPVKTPVIVSLNPAFAPRDELVLDRTRFSHPQFDLKVLRAQRGIRELQGHRATYYCGAWLRNGFHEDGLWSAVEVGKQMGLAPPW